MLVSATVRSVLSDGLVLSFLTFFSGTVDPYHLQEPGTLKPKTYRCGSLGWRLGPARAACRRNGAGQGPRGAGAAALRRPGRPRRPLAAEGWATPSPDADPLPPSDTAHGTRSRLQPPHPCSEKQRVRARVLFVDPESKHVMLTLQRGLVARQLPANFPAMGQVFPDARVLRVDSGLGLLCALPSGEGQLAYPPGFCHISNAAEGRVAALDKAFKPDQRVAARVTGFRPLDGLAVLTLNPAVVNQTVFSIAGGRPRGVRGGGPVPGSSACGPGPGVHARSAGSGPRPTAAVPLPPAVSVGSVAPLLRSPLPSPNPPRAPDLHVGMPAKGTVAAVEDFGLIVNLTRSLTALVPCTHATEVGSRKAARKFKLGQAVTGLVLDVNHADKKVVLTLKPSLLSSKLKPITDTEASMRRGAGASTAQALDWGKGFEEKARKEGLRPAPCCAVIRGARSATGLSAGGACRAATPSPAPQPGVEITGLHTNSAPIPSSLHHAAQSVALGSRGHGVVTGVKDKSVFVSFFGKAKGMVPITECPLAPGQSLAEAYTVGQGWFDRRGGCRVWPAAERVARL